MSLYKSAKEKFPVNVLVALIIGVILGYFIATYVAGSSGEAVLASNSVSCSDTDGGANYNVAGTLSYKTGGFSTVTKTVKDICTTYNAAFLTENYCVGRTPYSETYRCPYGCLNGACIQKPTCVPKTCAGLGKNCGSVSNGCGGTLNCGTCESPKTCASNVCTAPQPICADSDDSVKTSSNPTVAGSYGYTLNISGTTTYGADAKKDYCYGGVSVNGSVTPSYAYEYYCYSSTIIGSAQISCENGCNADKTACN